jgi:endonuclease YncB( thermonuclease family)
MRARRLAVLACACIAVLALAGPQASAPRRFSGRVVGVHDGDTISVLVGRRAVKVRLEGIDCPELAQPYGRVAKTFTSDRVFGKAVEVEQTTVDRYGRSVGRVFVNGEDLSAAILAAGLAWHYTQYSADRNLDAAEQSARVARRGLWSQSNPVPPWVYRRPRPGVAPTPKPVAPALRTAPRPRAEPPVVGAPSGPFHGNVQSHVFHAPGCPNYNCRNCTAVFATREEAIAHGYKPAGDCSRRQAS